MRNNSGGSIVKRNSRRKTNGGGRQVEKTSRREGEKR